MGLKDKIKKQLDTATPTLNRPNHQAEQCAIICKDFCLGFAKWVIEKHKEYPNSILRYDRLFDVYEKEQEQKNKGMLHPKQKANDLFKKISNLMNLQHFEILEILDFTLETKLISTNLELTEKEYWESVRIEAKKIK